MHLDALDTVLAQIADFSDLVGQVGVNGAERNQVIVGYGNQPIIGTPHLVRPRRHAQYDGLVHAGVGHVRLDAGDGVGRDGGKTQVGLHIFGDGIGNAVGPDVGVNVNAHG